ncbi:hypothetical protein D3C75_818260 [compost metagenome]
MRMATHDQIRSRINKAVPERLLDGIILFHPFFAPVHYHNNQVGFFSGGGNGLQRFRTVIDRSYSRFAGLGLPFHNRHHTRESKQGDTDAITLKILSAICLRCVHSAP